MRTGSCGNDFYGKLPARSYTNNSSSSYPNSACAYPSSTYASRTYAYPSSAYADGACTDTYRELGALLL